MADFRYNLALVLGGGGARGLAHIGVLRVFQRANIRPDLIVGTSMGAVIGGMYAQMTNIDRVEEKILTFIERFGVKARWLSFLGQVDSRDHHDMFRDIAYYIKKQFAGLRTLTSVSLEDRKVLHDPLTDFLRDETIEECRIPFAAVALDLKKGRMEILDRGSIIESVYASAAVQGVFPPTDYQDLILCDGGPVAIVPVEAARNLGARYVVAVDVSPDIKEKSEFTSGLDILLRSDSISQDRLRRIDRSLADVIIAPRVHSVHWANFSKTDYCIKRGERAGREAIDDIRALLKARPWWKRIIFRNKWLDIRQRGRG
jgi:NTE family protein